MQGVGSEGGSSLISGDILNGEGGRATAEKTARKRRSSQAVWLWILALLFAVVWHAVWWVWLTPEPSEARLVLPETPRMSYLPVMAEASPAAKDLDRKTRTLWSPALFALPSRVGFSRSVLTNRIGIRPPLAMPAGDSRFLENPPPAHTEARENTLPLEADEIAGPLEAYSPYKNLPPVFTSLSVTGVIMRIELSEGLKHRRFERMDLPELPAACREKPWEAMASLNVDSEGRVRHVFLEKKSPSERYNTELVRKLFGWRLVNPGPTASGRVTVRCFASTQTATEKTEGIAP